MISLPIICGRATAAAGGIVPCISIANGDIAQKSHGRNGVVGVIHPNGVVNACGTASLGGRVAEGVGGTYAEIIIFIPISVGARADVGIGGFVLATDHGFAETGTSAVTEIARQAAIAHGQEILVGVGQGIDVAVGELRVRPLLMVTVGGVVHEAHARAQGIVAARILTLVDVGIDRVETVRCIIIIGGSVVDGRTAHTGGPVVVPTSDERHVVQVARVGHGVLLVLQNLVDDVGQLGGIFRRHAAVEHVGEVVVVHCAVIQVGHLLGLASHCVGHLSHVAYDDEESRRFALVDARVVLVLHETADGVVGGSGLCRGIEAHVETFLYLPINPRLERGNVVVGRNHDHVDGIGHQVRVVVIHAHDLAVVEHLLVNDVEIGAVGAHQHALGFGEVGTVEAHFHLDVVEHAQGVRHGVVAHRIDDQRADTDAAHRALHLNRGFGRSGEAAGLVGCGIIHKLYVFRALVLADGRLARNKRVDAVIGQVVIRCGVVDYGNLRRCPERHGQKLVRDQQFRCADFARSIGAFDGDFGEDATFSGQFDALDGAVAEGGAKRREVALHDFSFRFVAQVDAAILRHGENCAHGQN